MDETLKEGLAALIGDVETILEMNHLPQRMGEGGRVQGKDRAIIRLPSSLLLAGENANHRNGITRGSSYAETQHWKSLGEEWRPRQQQRKSRPRQARLL